MIYRSNYYDYVAALHAGGGNGPSSDEEDDYDPDEPMMEGSDDEFSDLEMDERDHYDTPPSPAALHHSPTHSGISHSVKIGLSV